MRESAVAIGLDLGSTRFKLGLLRADGSLEVVAAEPAPALRGEGLVREGEPSEFLAAATRLLDRAVQRWPNLPLGLVSQRSTFTVWDMETSAALIPMISWQDRRAANWCAHHRDLDPIIARHSGLLLSPHYLGPKLASILEDPATGPDLLARLRDRSACVGTLDTWLTWHWSLPHQHQTDLTMAARTALADIESGHWSAELCNVFGIPQQALAGIRPTNEQRLELRNGLTLSTCIADQAAGAGAVLHPDDNVALVNFGTGAFVLYPHADAQLRQTGYLTAPVLMPGSGNPWFVLEGTINGAGPALDRFHEGPTQLPIEDDCPEGFAIPDLAGIGAPHWREDIGLTLSPEAQSAAPEIKRRIVLEGLLFRVLEILTDVNDGQPPDRVLISGGVVRDPALALGLAQLVGKPIGQLAERETTLLGAARLAAGWPAYANPEVREIAATRAGAYLPDKYLRWRAWFAGEVAR